MGGSARELPWVTRSFQIYLAPPGAGPEYHHSGLKSGSVPPHPLTILRNVPRSAFILRHPVSQAQLLDPCSADSTGPPARDPTWERGAQTLKGTLCGSYSTTKGGCVAENLARARCTTCADENWAMHHVQVRHQNTPKKIGEILQGGCTTVAQSVPIGQGHRAQGEE